MIKRLAYLFVLIFSLVVLGQAFAAVTIKQRGDTAAAWTAANPVLSAREVGWETDTRKAKLGDGTTAWNALPYVVATGSGGVSDHGGLTGLGDDDHTHYLNNARGDARYSLLGHSQPASTISDSTATGRDLMTAADPGAVRTLLNTDQVTDTRNPNAHQHATADLSASTAFGRSLVEAANAAAGRTAMGTETGYGVNQLPPLQALGPCTPLGVCTDGVSSTEYACEGNAGTWTPYDSAALCAAAGGSWGSAVGFKFSSISVPPGGLLVGDQEIIPGSGAWASITGKPATFEPSAHSHVTTDVTGLETRLAAVETSALQIPNLLAAMTAHGVDTTPPVLTRTSPATATVGSTTNSFTLNYTASDPQGMDATLPLSYSINGGAAVAMTSGADSAITLPTPNVATPVVVTAKNEATMTTTDTLTLTHQTPVVGISPAGPITFADTNVGSSSATQQFTWSNTGLADATGFSLPALGGTDPTQFGLSGSICTSTLAAGGSCTANVVFSPTSAGAKSATVSAGGQSASLSGTGVSVATYTLKDTLATGATDFTVGNQTTRVMTATTITPSTSYTLTRTVHRMLKAGNPSTTITANVWANSAGSPGSLLATSTTTISESSVGTSEGDVVFDFSGVPLTAGTQYWVGLTFSGASGDTHYYILRGSASATGLSTINGEAASWGSPTTNTRHGVSLYATE